MKIIRYPASYKNLSSRHSVLTIGNFDGMHNGHRHLLTNAKALANKTECELVVFTFFPHPAVFFGKEHKYVNSLSYKINEIMQLGADFLCIRRFCKKIAYMSAEEFITKLVENFKMSYLVLGEDFKFGRERSGDINLIKSLSIKHGFELIIIPDQKILHDTKISSTLLKQAIANDNIKIIQNILGDEFTIIGKVIEGRKLARKLGFPTANIKTKHKLALNFGVYFVTVKFEDRSLRAVANYGIKPTVTNDNRPILEVHIPGFNEDLYGKTITIKFNKFLRPERKFENLNELVEQIKLDLEEITI